MLELLERLSGLYRIAGLHKECKGYYEQLVELSSELPEDCPRRTRVSLEYQRILSLAGEGGIESFKNCSVHEGQHAISDIGDLSNVEDADNYLIRFMMDQFKPIPITKP